MKILGIETSCDETSVAVVEDGVTVLHCATATSMNLHAATGGIIPENAARKQIEYMIPVLEEALSQVFPNESFTESIKKHIDAIAVTAGPGLIGSLLVGVETAKVIARVFEKPIIVVNHVVAHQYANWLSNEVPTFPALSLVVSGGHTDLVLLKNHTEYQYLGGTRDDAAGEAFDKCARLLSLPYPGGPSLSKAANTFLEKNPTVSLTLFPRGLSHEDSFDMSFSGLKTAVARYVTREEKIDVEEISAEIQEAIVDALIIKVAKAIRHYEVRSILLSGGVSANARLRQKLEVAVSEHPTKPKLFMPLTTHATDNAAMIASCAFFIQNYQPIEQVRPNPALEIMDLQAVHE